MIKCTLVFGASSEFLQLICHRLLLLAGAKYGYVYQYQKYYVRQNLPLSKVPFNLLKPTGHVMHQQFNIQQLYVLPTLYLCVLYLSENK